MVAGLHRWQETLDAESRHLWQEQLTQEDGGPVDEEEYPDAPIVNVLHPAIAPRLISGQGLPGATLEVQINGAAPTTLVVDPDGHWQFVLNAIPGNYSIVARQQAAGGTLWSESTPLVVFVIHADVGGGPDSLGHGWTGKHHPKKDEAHSKPRPIIRIPGMAGWTGLAASRRLFPSMKGKKWPGE